MERIDSQTRSFGEYCVYISMITRSGCTMHTSSLVCHHSTYGAWHQVKWAYSAIMVMMDGILGTHISLNENNCTGNTSQLFQKVFLWMHQRISDFCNQYLKEQWLTDNNLHANMTKLCTSNKYISQTKFPIF